MFSRLYLASNILLSNLGPELKKKEKKGKTISGSHFKKTAESYGV